MADEKPTIEEEPKGTPPVEEKADIDVDAVMQELEAIGKTKPEEIRGMFTASQSTGKYANEIGSLRQEIERLKSESSQPRQTNYDPDYSGEQGIDLEKVIYNTVGKFWNDQQQMNQKAYRYQMEEMNAINTDEDYPIVRDVWEEHTKTPNFNMRINSGQTSYQREYDKVVRAYYRGVAKRSKEALEFATKQGPKPPHVESGSPPTPPREEGDDSRDKLRKIAAKATGTDEDVDKMIDAILPTGDAIYGV